MKRQAPEPLLPLRSAKQSRTTIAASSPADYASDGIVHKWVSLGLQTWNLSCETFQLLFEAKSREPVLPQHCSQTLARGLPPQNAPYHPGPSMLNPTTVPLPPSPSPLDSSHSMQSTPRPEILTASSSEVEHVPSKQSKVQTKGVPPRQYKNREHIFAKTHKTQLQLDRRKEREEMERELFGLKRRSGYAENFSEFQNYLNYGSELERIERKEMLSPSPSLTDLRSKPSVPLKSRRHSFTHDHTGFLERALAKARETFHGPKPPKPFLPSYEQLRLASRTRDQEIERRLRNPLPDSLPVEDDKAVDLILSKRGIVSKFAREQVTNEDLARLRPRQWLNDEIINFYGAMILGRSEASKENPGTVTKSKKKKPLNVHYFSTFFWTKLKSEGYDKGRLAKWTKKIDLFSKDIVLIPVNHDSTHWTCAAINFHQKRIESYDSMGMHRKLVYKLLREYIDSEHRNKKKGKPFDFTGWKDYSMDNTPQQENGYDCGVFTCQFLEALSRGEELFNFSQKNMPYFRRRMVWEIGNAKLREEP